MTINVCSALPRVSGPEGRPTPLAVLIAVALSVPTQAQARDEFNVRALEIDNPMSVPADLSRFTQAGGRRPATTALISILTVSRRIPRISSLSPARAAGCSRN